MSQHRFGWKPDYPDHRDYLFANRQPITGAVGTLPSSKDLRLQGPDIMDQGNAGSCVAHGSAYCLLFAQLDQIRKNVTLGHLAPEEFVSGQLDLISRLFIYYNARYLDGDPNQDNGTQIRSAIMAVRKWGISEESLWPYDVSKVCTPPPINAYRQGKQHLIPVAYSLNNSQLLEVKQCIAQGFPIVFGTSLFSSFMDTKADGLVRMPGSNDTFEGGHCMALCGYNDATSLFTVANSWGTGWGDKGFCYMPYAYLTSSLADDFWTLRA